MKMANIFFTVQGEGPRIGIPTTFVRFGTCDLSCPWCDTEWAQTEWKEMTLEEVVKEITDLKCTNITFTGGEPLLQQDAMIQTMEVLLRKSLLCYFEVETNGRSKIKNKRLLELVDSWVISPKLENAGVKNPMIQDWILKEKRGIISLKFVVDKREDLDRIVLFLEKHKVIGRLENEQIILMPQATTFKEHKEKLPFIIDFAKEIMVRVSPRLQIIAYGNKRGT